MNRAIMLMAVLFFTAVSYAQTNGGFRHGNNAQMRERMKQRVKDDLELSDAQADSVVRITRQYQAKIQAVKDDSYLSGKDREAQLASLYESRKAELKAILNEEQITKLLKLMQDMRNMRQQVKVQEDQVEMKE